MNLPVTREDIFSVKEHNFNELALKIFRYQAEQNAVYSRFIKHLNINYREIDNWRSIPFLPIEFFKNEKVITGDWIPSKEDCFKSSSTTGIGQSHHYYRQLDYYNDSIIHGFKRTFNHPEGWKILTLLPGYHTNKYASLIHMVKQLGVTSTDSYIDDFEGLHQALMAKKGKVMLIGVTHALIDFAKQYDLNLPELTIIETGGMKGRGRELTRQEVHQIIRAGFGVDKVGSEYGMTELFSQAYSTGDGLFETPPWMRVILREMDDPLSKLTHGSSGAINIIDLANIDSCAFIATSDVGRFRDDLRFEVLGRMDNSEVRGCNVLM